MLSSTKSVLRYAPVASRGLFGWPICFSPVFLLPDSLLASAASLRLAIFVGKGKQIRTAKFLFLVPAPKLLAAFPTAQIIAAIFGYWGFDFMLYRLLRFCFFPVFRADRWTWHVIPRPVFPHKPVFPAVPARISSFSLTMRQISSLSLAVSLQEVARCAPVLLQDCFSSLLTVARIFFQPVQFAFQSF